MSINIDSFIEEYTNDDHDKLIQKYIQYEYSHLLELFHDISKRIYIVCASYKKPALAHIWEDSDDLKFILMFVVTIILTKNTELIYEDIFLKMKEYKTLLFNTSPDEDFYSIFLITIVKHLLKGPAIIESDINRFFNEVCNYEDDTMVPYTQYTAAIMEYIYTTNMKNQNQSLIDYLENSKVLKFNKYNFYLYRFLDATMNKDNIKIKRLLYELNDKHFSEQIRKCIYSSCNVCKENKSLSIVNQLLYKCASDEYIPQLDLLYKSYRWGHDIIQVLERAIKDNQYKVIDWYLTQKNIILNPSNIVIHNPFQSSLLTKYLQESFHMYSTAPSEHSYIHIIQKYNLPITIEFINGLLLFIKHNDNVDAICHLFCFCVTRCISNMIDLSNEFNDTRFTEYFFLFIINHFPEPFVRQYFSKCLCLLSEDEPNEHVTYYRKELISKVNDPGKIYTTGKIYLDKYFTWKNKILFTLSQRHIPIQDLVYNIICKFI